MAISKKHPIRVKVSIDQVIAQLRDVLKLDKFCMERLLSTRVSCNGKVANHPTIQVLYDKVQDRYLIGLLGFLNGLFGIDGETGMGAIVAIYDVTCSNKNLPDHVPTLRSNPGIFDACHVGDPCPLCNVPLIRGEFVDFRNWYAEEINKQNKAAAKRAIKLRDSLKGDG